MKIEVSFAEKNIYGERQTGHKDHHGYNIPTFERYIKFKKGDPIIKIKTKDLQKNASPRDALYDILDYFETGGIDIRSLSKEINNLEEYGGIVNLIRPHITELYKLSAEVDFSLRKITDIIMNDESMKPQSSTGSVNE